MQMEASKQKSGIAILKAKQPLKKDCNKKQRRALALHSDKGFDPKDIAFINIYVPNTGALKYLCKTNINRFNGGN